MKDMNLKVKEPYVRDGILEGGAFTTTRDGYYVVVKETLDALLLADDESRALRLTLSNLMELIEESGLFMHPLRKANLEDEQSGFEEEQDSSSEDENDSSKDGEDSSEDEQGDFEDGEDYFEDEQDSFEDEWDDSAVPRDFELELLRNQLFISVDAIMKLETEKKALKEKLNEMQAKLDCGHSKEPARFFKEYDAEAVKAVDEDLIEEAEAVIQELKSRGIGSAHKDE